MSVERPNLYLVDKPIPFRLPIFLGGEAQPALPAPELEKPKKHKKFPRLRKIVGNIALTAGVALGSGIAGVTFLETPVPVGPHDAGVTARYDGQLTVQAVTEDGESSSISWPLDGPVGIGLHVKVDDLPFRFTKNSIVPTEITQEEVQAYASFFSNYQEDIKNATKEGRRSFEMYAALGASIFLGLKILRDEAKKRNFKMISASANAFGLAFLATITGGPLVQIASDHLSDKPTELKNMYGFSTGGIGVEGRLRQFIKDDQEAYDRIEENLRKQVEKHPSPFPEDGTIRVVIVEGLKCSAGMDRIVGKTADIYKPSFILSAGDNEIGDESFFRDYCMKVLADQTKGHDIVESAGFHSAKLSGEEEKKYHRTELKGEVIEKGGLRIIGDKDFNPPGEPGHEARKEMGQRIAEDSCSVKKEVNVGVVNEPTAGTEIAHHGCIPFVVTGGFKEKYKVITADNGEQVLYFLTESAGGAVYSDQTNFGTLGPLKNPAKIVVATFDKADGHSLLGLETITAHPGDGKVTVHQRITAEGDVFLSRLDAEQATALQPAG